MLVLTEFTVFTTNVSKQFQIVKWAVSLSSLILHLFKLLQIQTRRYKHIKLLKCQTFAWSLYFLICNVFSCLLIYQGKRRYNIKLWKTFTDCFNCLPVAAILDEKIFCCHGGKEIPLTLISLTEQLIKNENGSCCCLKNT